MWGFFLHESLELNRINEETVQAIWYRVMKKKEPFLQFLLKKQSLYNAKELCWTDQFGPLLQKETSTDISYKKDSKIIIENPRLFNEEISKFREIVLHIIGLMQHSSQTKGLVLFVHLYLI